jgi:hypothetical protein
MKLVNISNIIIAGCLVALGCALCAIGPGNPSNSQSSCDRAEVMPSAAGGEISYDLLYNGSVTFGVGKCFVDGQFVYTTGQNGTEAFLLKWDSASRTDVWRRSLDNSYPSCISGASDAIYISASYLLKYFPNGTKAWNASYFGVGGLISITGIWGNNSQLYITGQNYSAPDQGALYKIDAADGSVLFKRAVPDLPSTALWGDGNYLYTVGSVTGGVSRIYKYDLGGTQVWARLGSFYDSCIGGCGVNFYTANYRMVKWTAGGAVLWNVSAPASTIAICASTDAVFSITDVSGYNKYLYKWNATSGAMLWMHEFVSLTSSDFRDISISGNYLTTSGRVGNVPLIVRWSTNGFTGDARYSTSRPITVQGVGVNFTAPADAGDAPVQYQWNLGDGLPNATTANVSRVFSAVGDYLVKLHVRDVEGDTSFYNRTYRVLVPQADEDGDGMKNAWELAYDLNMTDPADAALDPDADEATNKVEHDHGSNPYLWDTDGDDLWDGYEIFTFGSDPTKLDTDGDGWTDDREHLHGSDPASAWSFPVNFLGMTIMPPLFGFLAYAAVAGIAATIIISSVVSAKRKMSVRSSTP